MATQLDGKWIHRSFRNELLSPNTDCGAGSSLPPTSSSSLSQADDRTNHVGPMKKARAP